MPVAIVPVPTTPTVEIGRWSLPSSPGRRRGQRVGDDLGRAGGGVGVEAAPALPAEQPGGDHLLEDRRRRVQLVARLLVHRVEDLVGRVEADEVHQRERAHRVAAAEAHGRVEVLAPGVVGLEHPRGLVEVAEEQVVGDEPGAVAEHHRALAERDGQLGDVGDHLRLGDDRAHDLDQLLHRRGVEEVHPDDLAGRSVRTDSSVIDSDEVLDAKIVSGPHTLSSSPNTSALSSRCSGTASTTRSASARSARLVVTAHAGEQRLAVLDGELGRGPRPAGSRPRGSRGRGPRRRPRPRRRPPRSPRGRTPRRCPPPSCRDRPLPPGRIRAPRQTFLPTTVAGRDPAMRGGVSPRPEGWVSTRR